MEHFCYLCFGHVMFMHLNSDDKFLITTILPYFGIKYVGKHVMVCYKCLELLRTFAHFVENYAVIYSTFARQIFNKEFPTSAKLVGYFSSVIGSDYVNSALRTTIQTRPTSAYATENLVNSGLLRPPLKTLPTICYKCSTNVETPNKWKRKNMFPMPCRAVSVSHLTKATFNSEVNKTLVVEESHHNITSETLFSRKLNLKNDLPPNDDKIPIACIVCKKLLSQVGRLEQYSRIHTAPKSHASPLSCKSFAEIDHLNNQLHDHTREKPHTYNLCSQPLSLHSCILCSKSFVELTLLKTHLLTHSNKKPHTCTMCTKSFRRRNDLNIHFRIHTGEKPFPCTVCSKSFNRKKSLTVHSLTHTSEKPYACLVCSKPFNQKYKMKIHLLTHTNEKPYPCTLCSRSFKQRKDLNIHLLNHTGEKPYACIVCSKFFNRRETMKVHLRTHTGEKPHVCIICSRSFIERGVMRRHLLTHTNEKPYTCTLCNKSFKRKENLNFHLLTHTGEKPHECTLCSKSFVRKRHLKLHLRTHANKKAYP